eukprot:611704-Rhodomonas_salina.1
MRCWYWTPHSVVLRRLIADLTVAPSKCGTVTWSGVGSGSTGGGEEGGARKTRRAGAMEKAA